MKVNHNEPYPNKFDQILFGRGAGGRWARPRSARPSTSDVDELGRQIQEVGEAFQHAHERGWPPCCGATQVAFKTKEKDYHVSADQWPGQPLGVTLEADIIKQKLPENNGGYNALNSKENPYGKIDKRVYEKPG